MLTPDRWRIVEQIFTDAAAVPEADRQAFLDAACEGDQMVRAEVESLLAADARPFLDASLAGHLAVDWLGDDQGDLKGTEVDHYRILSWLGAGGMGEVYIAEDTTLGRRVAIKVLPGAFTADASRLRRFTDEARAASALNHPNIVTVYGVGDVDGRPYIASELVEGETLRARLTRGPLPAEEALAIVRQLASALEAAHAAGIVHRDVKPENVMLRPDGYVKLVDFGVAKLAGSGAIARVSGPMTGSGVAIGTADYMGPEQAAGQQVDGRADVYSLCVVLFEMITSALPRELGSASDVAEIQMPPALLHVIRKGLASKADDRHQSAAELQRALAPFGQASSIPAGQLIVAGIALTILVAGGLAAWRFTRPPQASIAPAGAAAPTTLAVLPFQTIGLQDNDAYLGLGLTDAVITQVGALTGIRVRPTTSVREFTQSDVDIGAVARKLQVDHVLSGLVQRSGEQVRVTVQLINAASGASLWSARVDASPKNWFELQDLVSDRVVTTLLKDAGEPDRPQAAASRTVNPEAYEFYLRGRYFLSRANRRDLERALELFQQSVALDPKYALGHAAVAQAYHRLAVNITEGASPKTSLPLAQESAERALSLDPEVPEAHYVIGAVKFYQYDWKGAGESLERAARLRPNAGDIQRLYGWYLFTMGRYDDSLAVMKAARQVDPTDGLTAENYAIVLDAAGQFDEAMRQLDDAAALQPLSTRPDGRRTGMLERHERFDELIAVRQRILRANGNNAEADRLGTLYSTGGYTAVVKDEASRIDRLGCIRAARVSVMLDRKAEAVKYLNKCVDEGHTWVPVIPVDGAFAALHGDRAFTTFLARINR
jgi:TolB-like protein/Tfp pilus assembly protein PilF